MPTTLVLSFIATDKPGVIERISRVVSDHDGNWLESRMAHLAEKFAGVATIQVSTRAAQAMAEGFSALQSDDFMIMVTPASAATSPGQASARAPQLSGSQRIIDLDLVGPDHPGILHDITECLAGLGVSIEDMETGLADAPFAGGKLFQAAARLRLPEQLDEDTLTDAVEEIAEALMVDVSIHEPVDAA